MIFNTKKVLCYVLLFDQVDIIKKTLDFITKSADKLEIVMVENPSDNTPTISKMVEEYGQAGLVSRYYLFDENITNNAFNEVFKKELKLIKSRPYVITSDGDMTCDDEAWLDEELGVLKRHRDVFAVGVTLDKANLPLKTFPSSKDWIPTDKHVYDDYCEALTGAHLLMFRGKEFGAFFDWKEAHGGDLADGAVHKYCYDVLDKKWARTKKAVAYHLTWDLYLDKNHPYTQLKLSKSFEDTWYHKRTSGYKLKVYK